MRAGAIVLDLGSTKREITRAMEMLPASIEPIGGHPMCGKEVAGFDAADAGLFRGAPFVLTPLARTSPSTLACAETIALAVGARPLVLDAARHDRIVATTSHLPFALAALLMITAEDLALRDALAFTLAASGFRDTSRLAASDTHMMGDVLLTNSRNVASVLRDYGKHLNTLADAVEREDESALNELLLKAATRRREMYHP
jgi:prephenate dehydrogenase